jgi:hypothetical protein
MADELAALTLLGESADWLKDAQGTSIREHRLAALDAYEAAWAAPLDNIRLAALQDAFGRLCDALRHNHLYPEAVILGRAGNKGVRYLPAPGTLRKDFDLLRNFCVVNKFGIGEIHLLQIVLLLSRLMHQPDRAPYDQVLEEALADVLFLRVPIYRADNLGPYSAEVKARFHVLRVLRSMMKLGLFDESPLGALTPQDQAEARAVVADELRATAERYVLKPHRLSFQVFETATTLEEFVHAHAAGRTPLDERSPEELFIRLRHRTKRLAERPEVGPILRGRLLNLSTAAMIRAMAHVDPTLGREIYSFLRASRHKPTVRHARMFELLPNDAERLRFLNFLYLQSKQNPVSYVKRFQEYFPTEKLRFVHKDVGFTFEPAEGAKAAKEKPE